MSIFCLSACTIQPTDIGLTVVISSNMNVTAKVTITNIDLEEFNKGADLDKITICYAYNDDKKSELDTYKNHREFLYDSSVPNEMGDGNYSVVISDSEVAKFRASGKNYWEKEIKFNLPNEAKDQSVDYLVRLDGKDSNGDDVSDALCTSDVFTFVASPPEYTVTIPATVSLGQTADVKVDFSMYEPKNHYVCVRIQGDGSDKFTLSQAEDKLEYTISAKYPYDNKN